jgi:hypothetical protein
MDENVTLSRRRARWLLVLASGLVLFLELSLIRWAGASVVHLSYFSNFVLLGSFLGIGLGFLIVDRGSLVRIGAFVLALFVTLVHLFPVELLRSYSFLLFFGGTSASLTGFSVWLTLPLIFVSVTAIFACLGQAVAQLFRRLPSLEAYRYDLVGSMCGIVLFSLVSFAGLPPVVWGGIAAAGLLTLAPREHRRMALLPMLVLVVILLFESFQPTTWWSSYYKVTEHTY